MFVLVALNCPVLVATECTVFEFLRFVAIVTNFREIVKDFYEIVRYFHKTEREFHVNLT